MKIKMMFKVLFVSLFSLVSANSKVKVETSSTFTPNIKRRIPTSLKLDQRRCYSTKLLPDVKILHPWWITGYTDGEGSFMINISKSPTTASGYTLMPVYQITVHYSDEALLHAIKVFFKGVGNIEYTADKRNVSYRVKKLSDIIKVIIPHFDKYPLQSTKFIPFYLFKAVVNLMDKKTHLTPQGFREVLTYKAALKKGLAAKIFQLELFSDIKPFNTEGIFVKKESVLEPEYISGFVAADGSFFISKPSDKTKWPNYDATFSVAQDKRDVDLLSRIILTLDCGNIKTDSSGMQYLSVRNKEDLQLKIIPFFTKYSINSEKHSDFIHFSSAVSILYENKGKGLKNLTQEQREHLDFCISQMNKNRYSPS